MKKKARLFSILYAFVLLAFSAYVVLDALVIPRSYAVVDTASAAAVTTSAAVTGLSAPAATTAAAAAPTTATVTDNTYESDGVSITVTTYRESNTNIYVADITLASADSLKTAFAKSTYGKNITEATSAIAADNNAILAINGDYYGVRSGYVIRNGVLYRSTSAGSSQEDLVVWADGSVSIVNEGSVTAEELLSQGAQQVLSFGPALLQNGEITVSANEEVGQAMASNPRTVIGVVDDLHYVMVVSDGRTSASTGLTLYQMAGFLQSLGVTTAYNLDGGGSSTMVFNGTVVNQPTTNGRTITERSVSDIVYIG